MSQSTFDQIKPLIMSQLSPLTKLIGIGDREMDKALIRYALRIKEIIKNDIQINQAHCLFDWAMSASRGDQHSKSFISFIHDEISQLLASLSPNFLSSVKKTAKQIVFSFDDNPELKNNPSFMNYLGEIVGLNFILQKEKTRFNLLSVEKKLANSKSADFEFLDNSNGDVILIEFVSLHGIDPSKIENVEVFKEFLESRFNQKIEAKTVNLISHHHRIEMLDGSKPNFTILPILWSEVKSLLPFRKAFDELNHKYSNVLPCVSLLPQLLENEAVHFSLATVSNILDRWEQQR